MKIKLLHPDSRVPTRATCGSAGYDLYSVKKVELCPKQIMQVDTGIALEIPDGQFGLMCPRSGLARKHGITILNSPGIIDSDYRGELSVILINHSLSTYTVQPGERIAQLLLMDYKMIYQFVQVDELEETHRGVGGWGSTGK